MAVDVIISHKSHYVTPDTDNCTSASRNEIIYIDGFLNVVFFFMVPLQTEEIFLETKYLKLLAV